VTAAERYATVVVDMQNDYVEDRGVLPRAGMENAAAKAIVPRVRELVEFSRAQRIPVIWVTMVWENDADVGVLAERSPFLRHEGLRRNTWGAQLVDGLDVRQGDYVVEKKRFSAFYDTRLEGLLHNLGITHLLVAGVRSDFCVESTVRDAFFRDFRTTIVRDCVAGYFPELHENSLRVMGTVFARVLDLDEVKTLFAPAGARG
jgi:ureidoacrylate peracid hydrolase